MKKYDVVFVLPMPTLKIVGGYKMIYEYANYIEEKGKSVCIVYNGVKGKNSKHFPHILVYIFRILLGHIGPNWFKLNRKVNRKVIYSFNEKYIPYCDKIIASTARSAVFVNSIQRKAEKKFYFIQGFENWEISTEKLYETYSFDMKKITVAKWLKKEIEKYSNESTEYIPNGINTEIFKVNKEPDKRNPHSIALLYHLDSQKGFDVSYKVINKLKRVYPDLVVNMFGSPEKNLNWPEWIHYTRNASPLEVSNIMNDSVVFLCTSRMEGYGLTGLESLFCGCQLVSTKCLGVQEYATEQSALLCDIDDVESIFENVCKAFDDERLRYQMLTEFEKYKKFFKIEKAKEKFYEVVME